MKNGKLSFDEMSKKSQTLTNEEQLQTLGGRRGRGGKGDTNTWSTTRGGIIEDDVIIRLNSILLTKGK